MSQFMAVLNHCDGESRGGCNESKGAETVVVQVMRMEEGLEQVMMRVEEQNALRGAVAVMRVKVKGAKMGVEKHEVVRADDSSNERRQVGMRLIA